jgi:hypothetical protein
MLNLLIISLIIFILNIPFGYWRANVKRFSLQWYLSIHIPVPIIIAIRIFFEIGFSWYTYLFLITAFFLGQKLGSYIYTYLKKLNNVSSCLLMDLYRKVSNN